MLAYRGFAVALFAVHVAAAGVPTSVEADSPEPAFHANDEAPPVAPDDRERHRDALREEFIQARREFARVTSEALTSEEVKTWVHGLSRRVRLRRMEEDLREVRSALGSLERTGGGATERAARLAKREADLARDIEQLHAPAAVPGPEGAVTPAGGVAMPDQATVRQWIERQMSEETNHLADTLSDRELARRTRRLHRLASLAQFARRIQRQRSGPEAIPQDGSVPQEDEGVIPASGVEMRADQKEEAGVGQLGKPTTVPPELPEPAPQKGTTGPTKLTDDDRSENLDRPAESPSPNE